MSVPVTQFIRRLNASALLQAYADTSGVRLYSIPVPDGRRFSPTQPGVGTEFHEAFHAKNQGSRISGEYYPYVNALRSWLFKSGAEQLWTEWSYAPSRNRWHGDVDASVAGGPKPYGVMEIKVSGDAPPDGFVEDWGQLACYGQLSAESGRPINSLWAALVYVRPRQQMIDVLVVTDVARLTRRLERLVAA